MNFFTTERFTNALQAVGNIIAPLPEDYPVEDDHEDLEENIEENEEAVDEGVLPDSESDEEEQGPVAVTVTVRTEREAGDGFPRTVPQARMLDPLWMGERKENPDEIKIFTKDRIEINKETQEEDEDEIRGTNRQQEGVTPHEDSIHSADWSPVKVNSPTTQVFVDSDTESIGSEHSSPQFNHPRSPESELRSRSLTEDEPEEQAEDKFVNQLVRNVSDESKTLEALKNELKSYKSKVASAFAEISSLSDDLRKAIGQNRDYERKLETERETHRMLLSRIESLSQSKEELVIKLSEALESNDHRRQMETVSGAEREKEKEAYGLLSERYGLVVNEKQRLTEALSQLKEDSQRTQEAAVTRRCQEMIQRISTPLFQLLETIAEATKTSSPDRFSAQDMTTADQTLCHLLFQATETLRSHRREEEESLRERALQVAHSQEKQREKELEIRSLAQRIVELEGTLRSEIDKNERSRQRNDELQQELSCQSSRCSELELQLRDASVRSVEMTTAHHQDMEKSLKRVQELERELEREREVLPVSEPNGSPSPHEIGALEGSQEQTTSPAAASVVEEEKGKESELLLDNELHALRSQLEELQQEREAIREICRSFSTSSPLSQSSSGSGSPIPLTDVLKELKVQWKELQRANEMCQRSESERSVAHGALKTEHERTLKSLQEVTHERDSLKRVMTDNQSKLDGLLRSIGEMKLLKEESEKNKREFMRMETENRQLHQVVSQLRAARRTTQENADTALADRQSSQEIIEQQRKELQELRDKLNTFHLLSQENTQLRETVTSLKESYQKLKTDSESQLTSLTSLSENSLAQLSDTQRCLYELEIQFESSSSELKLTKQELTSRLQELENLHQLIQSIETDATQQQRRCDEVWKLKTEKLEMALSEKFAEECQRSEAIQSELKLKLEESLRQVEDERLLRRKFEIEMSSEKKKLHLTLQHALSQLQNSQMDSIDRMLIKNLILRYFQQKRSLEVLSVIARVLQFSNEEKIIVGLEVPSGSIISSLFSSFSSLPLISNTTQQHHSPQTQIQGENLAEMWLNFLIHESEGEIPAPPAPPSSLPSPLSLSSPPPRISSTPLSSPSSLSSLSPSGSMAEDRSLRTNGFFSTPPSLLAKPPTLRTRSDDSEGGGESEQLREVNGVRQVAPSPVLYPLPVP